MHLGLVVELVEQEERLSLYHFQVNLEEPLLQCMQEKKVLMALMVLVLELLVVVVDMVDLQVVEMEELLEEVVVLVEAVEAVVLLFFITEIFLTQL